MSDKYFSNGHLLLAAYGDVLEKLHEQIKGLPDAKAFCVWLHTTVPHMDVYVAHADYVEFDIRGNGKLRSRDIRARRARAWIHENKDKVDIVRVTVKKKKLKRSDLSKLGIDVFFTAQECLEAIGASESW